MTPPSNPKASAASASACAAEHPYTDIRERPGYVPTAPKAPDEPDDSWEATWQHYHPGSERSYSDQNKSSRPYDWSNPDPAWSGCVDEFPPVSATAKGRGKSSGKKGKGTPSKGGRTDKSQGKGGHKGGWRW